MSKEEKNMESLKISWILTLLFDLLVFCASAFVFKKFLNLESNEFKTYLTGLDVNNI